MRLVTDDIATCTTPQCREAVVNGRSEHDVSEHDDDDDDDESSGGCEKDGLVALRVFHSAYSDADITQTNLPRNDKEVKEWTRQRRDIVEEIVKEKRRIDARTTSKSLKEFVGVASRMCYFTENTIVASVSSKTMGGGEERLGKPPDTRICHIFPSRILFLLLGELP